MLKEGLGIRKIYIACGYTDLRYGVDGLASLIQYQFRLDPFDEGTLFLFCGRRADRIKALLKHTVQISGPLSAKRKSATRHAEIGYA